MSRPSHCSEKLYQVMLSCWKEIPTRRPDFGELCVKVCYYNLSRAPLGLLKYSSAEKDLTTGSIIMSPILLIYSLSNCYSYYRIVID